MPSLPPAHCTSACVKKNLSKMGAIVEKLHQIMRSSSYCQFIKNDIC